MRKILSGFLVFLTLAATQAFAELTPPIVYKGKLKGSEKNCFVKLEPSIKSIYISNNKRDFMLNLTDEQWDDMMQGRLDKLYLKQRDNSPITAELDLTFNTEGEPEKALMKIHFSLIPQLMFDKCLDLQKQ